MRPIPKRQPQQPRPNSRVQRLDRILERVREEVDKTTLEVLIDIDRRSRMDPAADGYPSGGEGGGVQASSDSSSTERAALQDRHVFRPSEVPVRRTTTCRECYQPQNYAVADEEGTMRSVHILDPVQDMIRELTACLGTLDRTAMRLGTLRESILHAGDGRYGRESSLAGQCQACLRAVAGTDADRLRSGYCERHYRQWLDRGKPDRLAFEMEVRHARGEAEMDEIDRLRERHELPPVRQSPLET